MFYIKIVPKRNSTVMEDIVKPQIKHSVEMFDYWIWDLNREGSDCILQLRYSDDCERFVSLLKGLKDIEKAKEISCEDYKKEIHQAKNKPQEAIFVTIKQPQRVQI